MSAAAPVEWIVPATIADERLVTVTARTAEEARDKVLAGKYKRFGPTISRGFLTVGEPARAARTRAGA